jgi:Kef-type K+ transport system membrane component KefB
MMWPLLIGCIGLSIWSRYFNGPWWAPLLSGALTFVLTLGFGRWWMSVYRRELAEEGQ